MRISFELTAGQLVRTLRRLAEDVAEDLEGGLRRPSGDLAVKRSAKEEGDHDERRR